LAQEGCGKRSQHLKKTYIGKYVELFSGLIKDARGGTYYPATRTEAGKHTRVLVNTRATEGLAKYALFPLPVFENVVLQWLREIDPAEVVTADAKDRTPLLEAELTRVQQELAEVRADLELRYLRTTVDLAAKLEIREAELVEMLEDAQASAVRPATDNWKEAGSLIDMLATTKDVEETRLRLRAAIRRIVESISLLVVPVPGKRERLAFVYLYFRNSPKVRLYGVVYHPASSNHHQQRPARFWATSFDVEAISGQLKVLLPEQVAANCELIKTLVESRQRGEQIEIVDD
jgi:hypothetical protein